MTQNQTYDVVIVGASLAGSAAAILFGRCGLKVALVERCSDPKSYKTVCNHNIQAGAIPTIERLGLTSKIEAAGGVRQELAFWTRYGWVYPTKDDRFPSYGYNISRKKLDPMIREMAANTTGVDLFLGCSARQLLREGNRFTGVVVQPQKTKQMHTIHARLTVGADGRNSRVGQLSGVSTRTWPNNRFSYFAYYRDLPGTSPTQSRVWFCDPQVAYAFPNEDGVVVLTCMPTKEELVAFKEDKASYFLRTFSALPSAPQIIPERRISPFIGMLDLSIVVRRPALPGLAFVGDAAQTNDPLWGVGCGWAMESAAWLVDCTSDVLLTGGNLDRALTNYRRLHRHRLAAYNLFHANYATGRRFYCHERMFYAAATRDEVCARHLHAFASRHIGVLQLFSPTLLMRALWTYLTRRGYQLTDTTNPQGEALE